MNKQELVEKMHGKWEGLTARERILIVIFPIAILAMLVYIPVQTLLKNTQKMASESADYHKTLMYIQDTQESYRRNFLAKQAMRQKLIEADTKLVTRLNSMASALGFDVTVNPQDYHKTSDDSGAEEQVIEITLRDVDYNKFLEYLVQIHNIESPVFIRHLNMTRTSNTGTDATKLSVTISLVSYRLKDDDAA